MRVFQMFSNKVGRYAVIASAVTAIGVSTAQWAGAQSKPKAGAEKKSGLDIMLMQPKEVKSGDNQFEVMVNGADGKPVEKADVSLFFVMPPMGAMGEMKNEVKLNPAGAGKYTGSGNVMMAGKWNVVVSVKQNRKEIGQKKLTLTAK